MMFICLIPCCSSMQRSRGLRSHLAAGHERGSCGPVRAVPFEGNGCGARIAQTPPVVEAGGRAPCVGARVDVGGKQRKRLSRSATPVMLTRRLPALGAETDGRMGIKYYRFIDGLRALAVGAVIINHFEASLLPGGYLGIDIFFVISGFVITSSLLGQQARSASGLLVGFYARRIKRLLPALLVCVVATSIAISLFNPLPRSHLVTGLASLVGLSNIVLYRRAADYWGETARLDPFTHTWSLGVEEQFYLLFPALVWMSVARNSGADRLQRLALVCAAIGVVSFAGFAYLYARSPHAAYFLPVFRFWQLCLGCIVALWVAGETRPYNQPASAWPPVALLGGILALLFAPAGHEVSVTLGVTLFTAFLIAWNARLPEATLLLTNAPMLYIGRISYSLYLWHWPVVVLSLWTIGIHWWSWPIQLALIACLAVVSYHGVEHPLRYAAWSAKSAVLAVALLTLWVPVLALGLLHRKRADAPSLFLGIHSRPATMQAAGISCDGGQAAGSAKTIRIIGNSHSLHILPTLQPIAQACGGRVVHSRHDGDYVNYPRGAGVDAGLAERALEGLQAGDILILSSRYQSLYQRPYLNSLGETWQGPKTEAQLAQRRGALDAWLRELDDLLGRASTRGIHVVQFLPAIELDTRKSGLPPQLCVEQWFRILNPGCSPAVSRAFLSARFPRRWFEELAQRERTRPGFHVFDPIPVLCPAGAACPRIVHGINVLRDTNHLSVDGALLLVQPFASFLKQRKLLDVRSGRS